MELITAVQSIGSRIIVFLSVGRGMIPDRHNQSVDDFISGLIREIRGET